jgi:hypothetical protein
MGEVEMGCNCGGKNNVAYSVKLKDGTVKYFDTTAEAQAEIRRAKGGMLRAVPRSQMTAAGK